MSPIKKVFEKHLPRLEKTMHEFPWESKSAYATYCAQTFYYVTHSTELLSYAMKHTENKKLIAHLTRHRKEETGHHKWAENDVKALGFDTKDFPIFSETKAIYESIYREIERAGPAAIMAYAMSLEGVSARALPSIYKERIAPAHGDSACAFVRGHSDADPHHVDSGFKAAELLTKAEQEAWQRVFIESIDRYIAYLKKIEAYSLKIAGAA